MKLKYLIPFLIFVALVALFAYAFRLDPREVPSPLVGKPAPAFALPRVDAPGTLAGPADLPVCADGGVRCLRAQQRKPRPGARG